MNIAAMEVFVVTLENRIFTSVGLKRISSPKETSNNIL